MNFSGFSYSTVSATTVFPPLSWDHRVQLDMRCLICQITDVVFISQSKDLVLVGVIKTFQSRKKSHSSPDPNLWTNSMEILRASRCYGSSDLHVSKDILSSEYFIPRQLNSGSMYVVEPEQLCLIPGEKVGSD